MTGNCWLNCTRTGIITISPFCRDQTTQMYGNVFRGFPYGAWSLGWCHRMTPGIHIRHDLGIKLQTPLITVIVTQDWTLCRFLYASWILMDAGGHMDWFLCYPNRDFLLKNHVVPYHGPFRSDFTQAFSPRRKGFFLFNSPTHWKSWEVKWFVIPKQLRAAQGRWMIPPFPLVKFGRWRVPWIWGRKWRLVPWFLDDGWFRWCFSL